MSWEDDPDQPQQQKAQEEKPDTRPYKEAPANDLLSTYTEPAEKPTLLVRLFRWTQRKETVELRKQRNPHLDGFTEEVTKQAQARTARTKNTEETTAEEPRYRVPYISKRSPFYMTPEESRKLAYSPQEPKSQDAINKDDLTHLQHRGGCIFGGGGDDEEEEEEKKKRSSGPGFSKSRNFKPFRNAVLLSFASAAAAYYIPAYRPHEIGACVVFALVAYAAYPKDPWKRYQRRKRREQRKATRRQDYDP